MFQRSWISALGTMDLKGLDLGNGDSDSAFLSVVKLVVMFSNPESEVQDLAFRLKETHK